ncbi:unnamed protein product [Orchesella dallaii]|uniref:Uncharacterized protein n=1 Tax=Orchesella dallaii TaxID=48710 RepID=A0ABP1RUJ6_9HEXA
MEVNPVSIANEFLNRVKIEFPHFIIENAIDVEESIARKLVDEFFAILTDAANQQNKELDGKFLQLYGHRLAKNALFSSREQWYVPINLVVFLFRGK